MSFYKPSKFCLTMYCVVIVAAPTATAQTTVSSQSAAATTSAGRLRAHISASQATPKHDPRHAAKCHPGRYHYKTYFVPPPPAYMPSILPELAQRGYTQQSGDAQLVKKPENPYKKYVHTPDGDAPEPVQVRKGVVTWTPHN